MKRSISGKILWLEITALFVGALLISGVAVLLASSVFESRTTAQLQDITEKETIRISAKLKTVEEYVKVLYDVAYEGLESKTTVTKDSSRDAHTQKSYDLMRATLKNVDDADAAYLRYNPVLTTPTSGVHLAKNGKNGDVKKVNPIELKKNSPKDVELVGWYYLPVKNKDLLWVDPWYNKSVEAYTLSCVKPIFKFKKEIGVVGVDMDFGILASEISKIKTFETGYAYLERSDGKVAYHPMLKMGEAFTDTTGFRLSRTQLPNGMSLVFAASERELNSARNGFAIKVFLIALLVAGLLTLVSVIIVRKITRPLVQLSVTARQMTVGRDMDVAFETGGDDEIGELSESFNSAQGYMKKYLEFVRSIAQKDSLTGVRNKLAYDKFMQDFARKVERQEITEYGIVSFDVNDLKLINDEHGNERGNQLLQNSCNLICRTFSHSPVFRVGGDEFVAILVNDDYADRKNLITVFYESMARTVSTYFAPWEQVSVALGLATYKPSKNDSIDDVKNRADEAMMKMKAEMKAGRI